MRVAVKWLKSPRHIYGIPRAPGTSSLLDADVAKKIRKESPGMFESPELDELLKPKAPIMKKAQTRPLKREKED